ncbi:MAG: DnaJ domain-containing protein [Planctomycetota bacterium]
MLGLDRGANPSLDEIRDAYRRLAQQYHPDRVNHLAPEFRKLAETKFRQIKSARDQLVGDRDTTH